MFQELLQHRATLVHRHIAWLTAMRHAMRQSRSWETFEELRWFRTGGERVISLLKRNFGLGHCDWCGFEGFESYVWTSVLSGNLVVLARLRLTRKRVHE